MSATITVPGCWTDPACFHAARMEGSRWLTSPRRLTLQRGHSHALAMADLRGVGRDARWHLTVSGWSWLVPGSKTALITTKQFMTRAGAMLEAEDIIQSAAMMRV